MKSKKILINMFLPLLLTGCTLTAGVETLLVPPKLDRQQQDIYNALKSYTGENINLKYPKSGKNLSAFIIEDIDDDSEDEAIVFYKKNSAKSDDSSLRINILDTVDSKWQSVYDNEADGNEIEQVEVTKLGDSEKTNIIVGYSLINRSEKKISIYDYSDGTLNVSLLNEPYSVFQAKDYNNDGTKELFIASEKTSSREAVAVLYYPHDNDEHKRSELVLETPYAGYSNITADAGSDGSARIFLDAQTGNGNSVTEVFKIDGSGNLYREFSPDIKKMETMRPSAYLSADIDGDAETEIPVAEFCSGYDENSSNPLYFTSWYNIENKKLRHKCETYMSITDGYMFFIPSQWYGKITARSDVSKNEISVCSGNDPETAEEIFTVKVVQGNKNAEISEEEGWTLIRTRGEKQFFLKINENNSLAMSTEEIIMKFKFDN